MDLSTQDVLKDTAVDVSQMDIPVALAAMMDGSRDVGHIHDGKVIRTEAPEWLDAAPPLPMDINNFPFSKFVSMHFKKQTLGVALSNPPSTLTHIPEDLHSDAMEMLKMVIQFTSGPELHGLSEFLFGNHVVHKGLMEGRLRDELLCQLANEAERAHGANEARRGWLLLALCLCVFTPSVKLQKYFLKYVSDHGSGGFAAICQRNLTHGLAVAEVLPGESRSLPPCLLEWHAASEHVAMALNITSFGGETILSPVDSWSRGEDVVGSVLKHKGMVDSCRGWSLALQENGDVLEIAGHDYVLDLISFLEHPPAFHCQPPTYLGSHSPDRTNFMNNSHGNAEARTSMPPVSPITPNSVGPTGLLCQTHNTANLEAASQHHFDGYIDKMLGPLPPSENGVSFLFQNDAFVMHHVADIQT
uniref:MyTH4 domain-containing protein n=1 Tax=Eptatretus burgeri TaxID=7764 RepID=A0A8C4Q059_EPTBU